MNKASSTLLAAAGIAVGVLGVALPASASVHHQGPCPTHTKPCLPQKPAPCHTQKPTPPCHTQPWTPPKQTVPCHNLKPCKPPKKHCAPTKPTKPCKPDHQQGAY